jgi:hypothetical protein
MIDPDSFPAATDPVEHHADSLELSALKSSDRSVSLRDFIRDLKLASADEAIADESEDGDDDGQTEGLAEAAFAELDDRQRACGGTTGGYPFKITQNLLRLDNQADESLYTFLALLSWYGKDAGPTRTDGEKVFEEICAKAAEVYLGGPRPQVKSYVFGFPRRVEPKGFAGALDKLCCEMGEGVSHRKEREKLPDQKDGKLDIVAWREFDDKRQGKLIAFGQCATGRDWDSKMSELPPTHDWCTNWLADRPAVWPFRSFFVPHRTERKEWFQTCLLGGLLYDRCRIASLGVDMDDGLKQGWSRWSAHVLARIRKS